VTSRLLSVDEGSQLKRVPLGFGSGASEPKTLIEGYRMTASGPRKLGQGSIDAGGGNRLPIFAGRVMIANSFHANTSTGFS